MTAEAYAAQLRAALPVGPLWMALRRGVTFLGLLLAWGKGLARFQEDAEQLYRQADPRFTTALLPEWERSVGLPDGCIPAGGSTQERRDAVYARLLAVGGCSLEYFQDLARALGYSDAVASNIGVHHWQIAVSLAVRRRRVTDPCRGRLRTWDSASLNCALERYKPAHTAVTVSILESE